MDVKELSKLIQNAEELPGIKNCSRSKIYRRQWLASIYFCLPMILVGMSHGHSSILMEELKPSNGTSNMKIENGEIFGKPTISVESSDTRSWIISLMILCMCPGCWILTLFSQYFGRKKVLTVSLVLFFASWIGIAFASDEIDVLIGRGFIGFTGGIVVGLIPIYIGECTIPKLRATFNAFNSAFFSFGVGLSHGLSIWLHWRTVAFIGGSLSLVTLILSWYTLVESPIWLLRKKRFLQAISTWSFWRGIQDIDELNSMYTDKRKVHTEGGRKFLSPSFLKPLGIIIAFFTVTQFSGAGAVTHYCIQMIIGIAGPDRACIPTLILDTFRLAASITSCLLTKRYSPRALSLFSAFGTSFFLLSLSGSILFNFLGPWFALVLLFSFEATVIIGLMSLPWVFCGELFSISHKEVGIGLATSYNYVLYFAVLKFNPGLVLEFQPWGAFLIYGALTTVGSIVLYQILPDTRNKSLKEIELMFIKVKGSIVGD